jgi:hypothetical protein
MDQKVPMENNTMKAIKQQMLRLPQKLCPERVNQQSQPELVRLLAKLLLEAIQRERSDKEGDHPWKR